MHRTPWIAAFVIAVALPAAAQPVAAPEGQTRRLALGADGVQIYACEARDGGHAWVFKGPEAALFDANGRQVGTHGAGPHWRLTTERSMITAEVAGNAAAPAAGAIPWLLLRVRNREGEAGLAKMNWVRRIDTVAGVAPREPCDAAHVGEVARMRYSAVYEFFGD